MRPLMAVLGCVMLLSAATPAVSQNLDAGQAICYEVERAINALADFTSTTCIPAAGKKPGTLGFILISTKPVFSTEASKKAWLLVVTGAVGKSLNDRPTIAADELLVSDFANTKRYTAYALPAAVARSAQRRVRNDQLSLDGMYSEIQRNLTRRDFKK